MSEYVYKSRSTKLTATHTYSVHYNHHLYQNSNFYFSSKYVTANIPQNKRWAFLKRFNMYNRLFVKFATIWFTLSRGSLKRFIHIKKYTINKDTHVIFELAMVDI